MSKKKILDPQLIQNITQSIIDDGLGETQIIKKYEGVSRHLIHSIAKERLLYGNLKYNNQLYKKNNSKMLAYSRHIQNCNRLDNIYGVQIDNIIKSGGILRDVIDIMKNIPHKQILQFLKYKKLDCIRRDNSKKYISKISRENGKKSRISLSNKEVKPITDIIVRRFMELKETLIYKQKVYDAIKNEFGFGERKVRQLCEKYGYPKNNPQTGNLNPMYGKSPGKTAGIGVKCWVLYDGIKYFCRSSLELRVICYLIDKQCKFEISRHRIPYVDNGVFRTYCPDIVIYDADKKVPHIYEIKPYNMVGIRCNQLKSNAAQAYCKKFGIIYGGFITEMRVDLSKYNLEYIMLMIVAGCVIMDEINLKKLRRNII